MPFTLSHVAAVLPLRFRFLLPSALVIGAMVPDVPLFVPLSSRAVTHSPLGWVTWDLGLGLLALASFHLLLKRPLLAVTVVAVGVGVAVTAFVRVPPTPYSQFRYAVTDSLVMVSFWMVLYSVLYWSTVKMTARPAADERPKKETSSVNVSQV